jgi:hypothetical protein
MITESDFKLDSTRLTLYHDKFKYRMSIFIRGIHFFRSVNTLAGYTNRLDSYKAERMYYQNVHLILSDHESLKHIRNFVKWRASKVTDKLDFKLRIGEDRVTIYSNDLTFFQIVLNKLNYSKDQQHITCNYSEPMVNYEQGVVYLKNPKRKFRIYMRSEKYTGSQRTALLEFIHKNDISMSPSLLSWLKSRSSSYGDSWAWSHYFFEFDQESLVTILCLKFDKLIRKVCTIQKR